jgi:hypothetical protein
MYAPAVYQSGASVSHFSTSLTPNELLEPYLASSAQRVLSLAALQDIGWVLNPATHRRRTQCDVGGDADSGNPPTATAVLRKSLTTATTTPTPTSTPSITRTVKRIDGCDCDCDGDAPSQ